MYFHRRACRNAKVKLQSFSHRLFRRANPQDVGQAGFLLSLRTVSTVLLQGFHEQLAMVPNEWNAWPVHHRMRLSLNNRFSHCRELSMVMKANSTNSRRYKEGWFRFGVFQQALEYEACYRVSHAKNGYNIIFTDDNIAWLFA